MSQVPAFKLPKLPLGLLNADPSGEFATVVSVSKTNVVLSLKDGLSYEMTAGQGIAKEDLAFFKRDAKVFFGPDGDVTKIEFAKTFKPDDAKPFKVGSNEKRQQAF